MKRFLLMAFAAISMSVSAQVKVSVLGDSYSTFQGYIPEGYDCWYFTDTKGNDVHAPEETWWSIITDANGLELEKNDSWSGATISYSGYRGEDYRNRSFNTRADRLGNPDLIYIFGGTNDSWVPSPVGEFKYSGWTDQDMYSYRPAMAALLSKMKTLYPDALIINICNSELSADITNSMAEICAHYGIPNVVLTDIDKQMGHPSKQGMKEIARQVWKQTAPLLYEHLKKH